MMQISFPLKKLTERQRRKALQGIFVMPYWMGRYRRERKIRKVSKRIFSFSSCFFLQIGAYIMLNCMKTRPNDCECKYYSKHFKTYNNPNNRKKTRPKHELWDFRDEKKRKRNWNQTEKCFRRMILCFLFSVCHRSKHDEVAFFFVCALNAARHSKLSKLFHQHFLSSHWLKSISSKLGNEEIQLDPEACAFDSFDLFSFVHRNFSSIIS